MFRAYTQYFNRAPKYSSVGFQNQMIQIFDANAGIIANAIEKYETEEFKYVYSSLMQNIKSMSDLISKFYGKGEEIQHGLSNVYNMPILFDIIAKKNSKELRAYLYELVDKLMALLYSFCDWNLREYYYKQITLMEAIAQCVHKKDKRDVHRYYQALVQNNVELSRAITTGIIKNNPTLFA